MMEVTMDSLCIEFQLLFLLLLVICVGGEGINGMMSWWWVVDTAASE